MTHAKRFSPSAAKRWMTCTASVALSLEAPPQIESIYAAEGTKAHELCEELLRKNKNLTETYPVEMLDFCVGYMRYVEDLAKARPVHVEQQVTCSTVSDEIYGTADAIIGFYGDEHIHVIDFKYGMVEVPIDSPQLQIYGLAAMMEYGAQSVTVHIYQPRTVPPNIVQKTYTREEMLGFELALEEVLHIVEHAPTFKMGDHCKYCPALQICPEQLKEFKQDLPDVQTIGPEDVAMILDKIPGVEAFIKQIRAKALDLASQGQEIKGWKRVAGRRGAKKWAIPDGFKMPPSAYVKKLKTPTQLAKDNPRTYRKLASHITQSDGKPTLVPESDRRKEIDPGSEYNFEIIKD